MKKYRNFKRQCNTQAQKFPLPHLVYYCHNPFSFLIAWGEEEEPSGEKKISKYLFSYIHHYPHSFHLCFSPTCLTQSNAYNRGLPGCQAPNRWEHSQCWVSLWAPFLLCFLSSSFHSVMSPVSKKEQYVIAAEISIFCYSSICKGTRMWSHRSKYFLFSVQILMIQQNKTMDLVQIQRFRVYFCEGRYPLQQLRLVAYFHERTYGVTSTS